MFAGEVGVIVLGVLIALTAQQIVDSWQAQSEVRRLRVALRAELADDRFRWEDMKAGDRCTVQRLEALERWAATAPADARLEASFRLLLWNMHSSAWDIAKTSAAIAQMPLDEQLTYASLFEAMDNWRAMLAEERENGIALSALLASADLPENRRQIARHLAAARLFVRRRQQNYPYFFKRFDALKIRPDASQLTVTNDPQAMCAPLPA